MASSWFAGLIPSAAHFWMICLSGAFTVSTNQYQVGIVGATGAVGQELFRLLLERNFPMAGLRLFASARSAGRVIERAGRKYTVAEAGPGIFQDLDVAFFSAGGPVTRALAPAAVKAGCLVLDKSSAFRMDPAVPLVIPEINAHAIRRHQGIIASPNCSTAVTLMGLYPLHRAFGLKRYFAATYQSVSGTGAAAVRELDAQMRAWAKGEPLPRQVYPHQIALNVIPQVDTFGANGYTGEENKMAAESRKILEMPALPFRPPACACPWCAPIRWRSTPSSSGPSTSPSRGRRSRRFRASSFSTSPRRAATRRRWPTASR